LIISLSIDKKQTTPFAATKNLVTKKNKNRKILNEKIKILFFVYIDENGKWVGMKLSLT
jgi:hypothetical protein